ncbi:PAS domain S-box-containing protein/diguanylate cyclase (GGDEF) domain-containing protein [Granulicella pectinivorans]|uniref:PAS domain S-box-containing protein/diguanylate cyclase (GGDEF) domain-containing protein n=1 Tax=Granulicella pectinivorans TaxID=474950 RepID=A0A1I6MSJ9_9BACT|nr:sensor domain-containing diguanylate cyclase [Granulicella pectinivorans]SFS18611.1 PAS domain S-box-containing protein/diguanylate cyclase (GGDEF) domain-containing protein [Granulicella pectinivorans]
MRGPLVDFVLLTLIVVFFGVQQRRRPEAYFRFWVWGWVLVLTSILVWEFNLHGARAQIEQEAVRLSLLACGGLAFVFSFVAKQRKGRISLLQGLLIAVPVCLGMELIATEAHGHGVLIALVVVGELISAVMSWVSVKDRRGWLLWLMLALCPVFCAWMIFVIVTGHADAMMQVALGHIFIVSGLLFSTMKRKGGRSIGSIGFFLWGACYLLAQPQFMPAAGMAAIYSIWTVPKFLVAFGMILKLFTKVNAEFAELNRRHVMLYQEYRLLFDSNPHPMWIYDVATRRFLAVNDAAVVAYGYPRDTFLRMSVEDLRGDLDAALDGDVGISSLNHVVRHRRADGRSFDVDVTGNGIRFQGKEARFVLAVDITERETLHRELVRQAHYDALTGLPNRVMLEDRIGQWLTRCIRENSMGAFLTVDIDHFKRVNDTYGHQAGDECLRVVADRLRSRVRQVDTIARTGGEEFTIVIGGLKSREGASKVCQELLKLFEKPIAITGYELQLSISIGVSLYPDDGVEIEKLRRTSDQALYRAKRTGRNRAVFAEPLMEQASA